MLNLLNFFADATNQEGTQKQDWTMFIVMGVLIVGMIIFNVISNKKAKKRNEEKNSQLVKGALVTTIGGIVGVIIELDDQYLWIETGVGENKMTMQILRQAIHSVGTPDATPAQTQASKPEEETVEDEIK